MNRLVFNLVGILLCTYLLAQSEPDYPITYTLSIKTPGNPAVDHLLEGREGW